MCLQFRLIVLATNTHEIVLLMQWTSQLRRAVGILDRPRQEAGHLPMMRNGNEMPAAAHNALRAHVDDRNDRVEQAVDVISATPQR